MERSLALDVAYLGVAEPGDGVAGTEFTQCVDVDTVTFNFSDAKELSFTSMGHEDPWAVVSRKGDPSSIEFTIPSPTSDEMKMFCGGTVSGDKWEAPLSGYRACRTKVSSRNMSLSSALCSGRSAKPRIRRIAISYW